MSREELITRKLSTRNRSNEVENMLLITGITGHTGRYFLQELINNKYEGPIRCIVRASSDTSMLDNSGLNIEKIIGDINDEDLLDKSMKNVDTVFHITNIRYTLKIIRAAINNNARRAICVHTTGIYSKFRKASEEYIDIETKIKDIISYSNIKVTILRPTMIYGDMCDKNMSKFIKMVDHLRIFPVVDHGKSLIQPVNARDLGKAYYSVLMLPDDKLRSEYILSGEKPITIIEALKLISDNLGKKTMFINVPSGFAEFLARIAKALTLGKIDYIEKVQRMTENRSFSHEEATLDFGYNPEAFEVGIAREVQEYFKNRK